jgi:arginyl-tRNA synthetase
VASDAIRTELARVATMLGAPAGFVVELETPRDKTHGDVATNVALLLAKPLRQPPRRIAEQLLSLAKFPPDLVAAVEIAGPGFINFRLGAGQLSGILTTIIAAGPYYGRALAQSPQRVNVEFVSANPTGPLHVAHGRGAALGDCVATLLEWQGHQVQREFYVNDAGAQIARLGESLWARVQQEVGREAAIPENGYHGAYLVELARRLIQERGPWIAEHPVDIGIAQCRVFAVEALAAEQAETLAAFRVNFDLFFEESQLYRERHVEKTLAALTARGALYEEGGALWLRTTTWGDDKDRVLRKSDGTFTYFLPDIAYHEHKASRGFDRAIDVWGADHHGYVPRMSAAMQALGHPKDFFEALIVQLVTVLKGGEEVKMSKRAGDFIPLRELVDEVGVDAARYFFLMRRSDTPFAFDIDLATRKSDENPVFYVQMAHVRMASLFRVGAIDPASVTADGVDIAVLTDPSEPELLKILARFPEVAARAAESLEPQRITAYCEELARATHHWYHKCRVLGEPSPVERARLALARAAQITIANALALLGLSAPGRM